MNQQERQEIALKIEQCAFLFGKNDLTKENVSNTINIIESVYGKSKNEIIKAYDSYMKDSKNKYYPAPAQLREYLENKLDSKLEATNLARQIDLMILKRGLSWSDGIYHGYFNNHHYFFYEGKNENYWTFKEALISELGELACNIIESRGGWKELCTSGQNSYDGIFNAQLRDHIEALLRIQNLNINSDYNLIEQKTNKSISI